MHQGLQLFAALRADKGVKLVDHEERDALEDSADGGPAVAQQRLQGFGGDKEHTPALGQKTGFYARRYIPMPGPDGNLQLRAQPLQAPKLVVDERFQWAHVDDEAVAVRGEQVREGGEKCGLGLSGGRGRRNDDVLLPLDDERDGLFLRVTQLLPAFGPDEALNALVQEVKRGAFAGHARLQSLKDASSSSSSTRRSAAPAVSGVTSRPPKSCCQSVPGFCSSTASMFTKEVMVVRGVRK